MFLFYLKKVSLLKSYFNAQEVNSNSVSFGSLYDDGTEQAIGKIKWAKKSATT